jgi:surfeit locus 1 family protein
VSEARGARFWIVTLAAITGVAATLALGSWQLGRGQQKEALEHAIDARGAMATLDASALVREDPAQWLHRSVVVHGTWDANRTVYLDNRQMQGRPGFFVVTPLLLAGGKAVLVERGWIPRDFVDRTRLAPVGTPSGEVEVRGRIAPPPARLYEFAGAGTGAIRQNLDLAAYRLETGLPLVDVTVVQTGPPSEGLLRDWPRPASGAGKNYGYAFQWWALSGLIVILYVWFQFIVPRRKARHAR